MYKISPFKTYPGGETWNGPGVATIAEMAERRVCVVARHLCSAPTSVTATTAASTLPPVVGGDPRVFATMSNCEDRTGGCDLQKLLPGPLDDERIRKVSLISVVFQASLPLYRMSNSK